MSIAVEIAVERHSGSIGSVTADGLKRSALHIDIVHKHEAVAFKAHSFFTHQIGQEAKLLDIIDLIYTLCILRQSCRLVIVMEHRAHIIERDIARQDLIAVSFLQNRSKNNRDICLCHIGQMDRKLAVGTSVLFRLVLLTRCRRGRKRVRRHLRKDRIRRLNDLCNQGFAVHGQLCGLAIVRNGNIRLRMRKPVQLRSRLHRHLVVQKHTSTVIKQHQATVCTRRAIFLICLDHVNCRIAAVVRADVARNLCRSLNVLTAAFARVDHESVLTLCTLAVIVPTALFLGVFATGERAVAL